MNKIFISTTSFAQYDKSCLDLCRSKGYEVIMNTLSRKIEKKELLELAKDAVGLIAGTEKLDQDVLSEMPNLKVISRCGAGIDNVDLISAKRLGIKVFNTPDAPTQAVAELTLGLILNLLRKINQMDNGIKNGNWEKKMGNLLSDKYIGIIGFGKIGKRLADLISPFNCKILYYDIRTDIDHWAQQVTFSELLKQSDIISIHVSFNKQIIGEPEIKQMKKGAWLVNVSRGEVIDEKALYIAIKEGTISGAALDVFSQEPYNGALKELNNIILTPHIGSYAKESRIKMENEAVENLLKGLDVK